jgi:hypothetical protein
LRWPRIQTRPKSVMGLGCVKTLRRAITIACAPRRQASRGFGSQGLRKLQSSNYSHVGNAAAAGEYQDAWRYTADG